MCFRLQLLHIATELKYKMTERNEKIHKLG